MKHSVIKTETCPDCGSQKLRRRGVDGYISGRELGRPGGAKGKEFFHIEWDCPECGPNVCPIMAPKPCQVCPAPSDHSLDGRSLNESVTGMVEWVPGLPSQIPMCDNGDCFNKLKGVVEEEMSNAFFE